MNPVTISPAASNSISASVHIGSAVRQLMPITLKELQAADSALMDRVDTKFTLTASQLGAILGTVADTYSVLTIEATRLQHYHTCYFDTPDLLFYQQHHNGHRNRFKVRSRTYLDSDLAFLEVKVKNNKERTIKHRQKTEPLSQQITPELQCFLAQHIPVAPESLRPQLANTFTRLTLVNRGSPERVTIDFDLCFAWRGGTTHYSQLVIAEVKQPRFSRQSPFVQALATHHSQKMGFSKYCMGIASERAEVKHNWFKPTLMSLAHFR